MDFFQSDGSSSEATGSNDVKKPACAGFYFGYLNTRSVLPKIVMLFVKYRRTSKVVK
jgi:hypothetical protein